MSDLTKMSKDDLLDKVCYTGGWEVYENYIKINYRNEVDRRLSRAERIEQQLNNYILATKTVVRAASATNETARLTASKVANDLQAILDAEQKGGKP